MTRFLSNPRFLAVYSGFLTILQNVSIATGGYVAEEIAANHVASFTQSGCSDAIASSFCHMTRIEQNSETPRGEFCIRSRDTVNPRKAPQDSTLKRNYADKTRDAQNARKTRDA